MKKKQLIRTKINQGFSLIEIVFAIGILTMSLVSVSMFYKKLLDVSQDTTRHIQSGYILEEGLEAIRLMRDASWASQILTLSTTTTYYFYWSGTNWIATKTPQVIEDTFTRSFTVSDVYRDGSDNIASAGTYGTGTVKIRVSNVWMRKAGRQNATDTAETYITNLFSN